MPAPVTWSAPRLCQRPASGAVIVETIFAWPGMGKLGVSATIERDYPLLMGVVVVGAIMVLLSNLIADIVYAWVDPRIHYD